MCNNQIRITAFIKQEIYSISDANTQKSAFRVWDDERLETLLVGSRVGVEENYNKKLVVLVYFSFCDICPDSKQYEQRKDLFGSKGMIDPSSSIKGGKIRNSVGTGRQ